MLELVDKAVLETVAFMLESSSLSLGTKRSLNSVGSECNPYKVEVASSNLAESTIMEY